MCSFILAPRGGGLHIYLKPRLPPLLFSNQNYPIMDADMVAMSTRGFQQQQHGHQQEYRFSDQHNSRYDQRFDDQRRYYPAESFYGRYEERHQDYDDYPRDMLHRSPFNNLVMHLPEVFNPVSYRLEKRSHIAVCSKSNYNSPRKPDALIA
ncbi:hypothetical protein HBI26_147220 [Parastagonospora nodorum]|nr:hypothetical protein HBH43_162580 [Parastagonospora nodorum]KAH4209503.1 hypothetical protein HBI95_076590 [Parastagonospora nodorum]KAH4252081.1 hypothetical protein HBI03_215480 [Parastagonospora nodorum]KAH4275806.1 hypothetical protein HBI04_113800 [Parastagonospora nodorum]KAH4981404.1 hypothetical protein HBI76_171440 [Parastagonospora nodorum]